MNDILILFIDIIAYVLGGFSTVVIIKAILNYLKSKRYIDIEKLNAMEAIEELLDECNIELNKYENKLENKQLTDKEIASYNMNVLLQKKLIRELNNIKTKLHYGKSN